MQEANRLEHPVGSAAAETRPAGPRASINIYIVNIAYSRKENFIFHGFLGGF